MYVPVDVAHNIAVHLQQIDSASYHPSLPRSRPPTLACASLVSCSFRISCQSLLFATIPIGLNMYRKPVDLLYLARLAFLSTRPKFAAYVRDVRVYFNPLNSMILESKDSEVFTEWLKSFLVNVRSVKIDISKNWEHHFSPYLFLACFQNAESVEVFRAGPSTQEQAALWARTRVTSLHLITNRATSMSLRHLNLGYSHYGSWSVLETVLSLFKNLEKLEIDLKQTSSKRKRVWSLDAPGEMLDDQGKSPLRKDTKLGRDC
jgi:hypothetical protein